MHGDEALLAAESQRAALPRNRYVAPRQRAGRGIAQRDHKTWPQSSELALQPPAAGGDFAGIRLLMDASLAARLVLEMLHHIGEVKLGAIEAGIRDGAIEQLAGWSDEGPAGKVLLVARLLAYEDNTGVGRAFAEHGLRRRAVQWTALAGRYLCPQPGQRNRRNVGCRTSRRHDPVGKA